MSVDSTIVTVMKAWERGEKRVRFIIGLSLGFVGLAVFSALFGYLADVKPGQELAPVLAGIAVAFALAVRSYENFLDERTVREKITTVEEQIRENPEKPQLAWELAQTKPESYLNRNLAQVRSIFWLTGVVMLVGFAFVLYGLVRAFDTPDKLPVAIVASASGVLISFIGGSFLVVYRSILSQSKEYVSVLERINAVGMAVQVLETIPDQSAQLKHTTTAEVAKELLRLYSSPSVNGKSEHKNG